MCRKSQVRFLALPRPRMVACACNYSIWEVDVGELGIQGHPCLYVSSGPAWAIENPVSSKLHRKLSCCWGCMSSSRVIQRLRRWANLEAGVLVYIEPSSKCQRAIRLCLSDDFGLPQDPTGEMLEVSWEDMWPHVSWCHVGILPSKGILLLRLLELFLIISTGGGVPWMMASYSSSDTESAPLVTRCVRTSASFPDGHSCEQPVFRNCLCLSLLVSSEKWAHFLPPSQLQKFLARAEIAALRGMRQEDHKLKASLDCRAGLS